MSKTYNNNWVGSRQYKIITSTLLSGLDGGYGGGDTTVGGGGFMNSGGGFDSPSGGGLKKVCAHSSVVFSV